MKAIVLAGGFAKRLYPITEFTPKPLLPVVGKPILQYIIEKIESIKDIDQIFISTNKRFEKHFQNWLSHFTSTKEIKLVVEESLEEKEKLGAIGALNYLVKKEKITEDLLIIAGDNLFDFELVDFVKFFEEKKSSIVAFYDIGNIEDAKRFGVAQLDETSKVVEFLEKPMHPKSTLISTCCYLFAGQELANLNKYITDKNNPDAPGFFIKWLVENAVVHGFTFAGKWFDIGHMDAYKAANMEYEGRLK